MGDERTFTDREVQATALIDRIKNNGEGYVWDEVASEMRELKTGERFLESKRPAPNYRVNFLHQVAMKLVDTETIYNDSHIFFRSSPTDASKADILFRSPGMIDTVLRRGPCAYIFATLPTADADFFLTSIRQDPPLAQTVLDSFYPKKANGDVWYYKKPISTLRITDLNGCSDIWGALPKIVKSNPIPAGV